MPAIIDKLPDAARVEHKIFFSYPEHPRVDFHDVELESHFLQFRGYASASHADEQDFRACRLQACKGLRYGGYRSATFQRGFFLDLGLPAP
jgi:hypothetical protein